MNVIFLARYVAFYEISHSWSSGSRNSASWWLSSAGYLGRAIRSAMEAETGYSGYYCHSAWLLSDQSVSPGRRATL